jgi:hypothetical protein
LQTVDLATQYKVEQGLPWKHIEYWGQHAHIDTGPVAHIDQELGERHLRQKQCGNAMGYKDQTKRAYMESAADQEYLRTAALGTRARSSQEDLHTSMPWENPPA